MHNIVEKEVHGLHTFFEAWYRGTIDDTDEAFSRIADVLAPEFTLVTASGYCVAREQLLGMLRTEYATKPEMKMRVENIAVRFATEDVMLATYEEHGTTKNGTQATLITAVLHKKMEAPEDLAWLYIHEVRLPS